ncbi:MAG: MFS transporter [Promethearchaeati archaeon SRVP18_Atabeyarchaeia-1]
MALEQQLDPKGVRLLQLSAGISSVIQGIQNLSFSIYLGKDFLNFDPAIIGLMFTASQVIGALFAIPMGVLADRWGRKRFVVAARFLQLVAFLPLIVSTDITFLLAGLIVLQVGSSMSSPPFSALLADKTLLEKRNATFSYNYVAMSVGSALGSGMCELPPYLRSNLGFDNVSSYRPLFISMLFIAAASLGVVTLVHERGKPLTTRSNTEQGIKSDRSTAGGRIAKYTLTLVTIQIGAGMIVQLFSLWLHLAFGVTELQLAPLYIVMNLSMGAGYLLANKLASLIGIVRSVVLTQLFATVLLVALPNIPDFQIVGIVYVLRTAIMNMSNPILTSFICSIVPVEVRASALGISNNTGAIARAFGPAIGGDLMLTSLALPFYICGGLYATSTVFFFLFFRRTKALEC